MRVYDPAESKTTDILQYLTHLRGSEPLIAASVVAERIDHLRAAVDRLTVAVQAQTKVLESSD
jgi:hypothetical protein